MSKQDRATCWSVTINNPIKADEDNIGLAKSKGWKVLGQKEKGETGTEHYQLMVKTPQVRFSAVKKAFPRAHIEIARNAGALEQYVSKEETRVGTLPSNKTYLSLNELWLKFYDYVLENERLDDLDIESLKPEGWLKIFDNCISCLIVNGFNVETMGVNPQIRSSVKNYGLSIYWRSQNIRRQEDSQTDEINIPTIDLNAGENTQQIDETSSRSSEGDSEDNQDSESQTYEGTTESECSSCSSSYN